MRAVLLLVLFVIGCSTHPSAACGDRTCDRATGESCSTCPVDCGTCAGCGDGVCNASAGESCAACPGDCGPCGGDAGMRFCGDGVCSLSESCSTCAADCGACPSFCGDGVSALSESCSTCIADCGACPPFCGDGTCGAGENCSGCPGDCGVCPCSPSSPAGACPAGQTCVAGGCCATTQACGGTCCAASAICITDATGNLSCATRCRHTTECASALDCCSTLFDAAGTRVADGACIPATATSECRCSVHSDCAGLTGRTACGPIVAGDIIQSTIHVCVPDDSGPWHGCYIASCGAGYDCWSDPAGNYVCARSCASSASCGNPGTACCITTTARASCHNTFTACGGAGGCMPCP